MVFTHGYWIYTVSAAPVAMLGRARGRRPSCSPRKPVRQHTSSRNAPILNDPQGILGWGLGYPLTHPLGYALADPRQIAWG